MLVCLFIHRKVCGVTLPMDKSKLHVGYADRQKIRRVRKHRKKTCQRGRTVFVVTPPPRLPSVCDCLQGVFRVIIYQRAKRSTSSLNKLFAVHDFTHVLHPPSNVELVIRGQ